MKASSFLLRVQILKSFISAKSFATSGCPGPEVKGMCSHTHTHTCKAVFTGHACKSLLTMFRFKIESLFSNVPIEQYLFLVFWYPPSPPPPPSTPPPHQPPNRKYKCLLAI